MRPERLSGFAGISRSVFCQEPTHAPTPSTLGARMDGVAVCTSASVSQSLLAGEYSVFQFHSPAEGSFHRSAPTAAVRPHPLNNSFHVIDLPRSPVGVVGVFGGGQMGGHGGLFGATALPLLAQEKSKSRPTKHTPMCSYILDIHHLARPWQRGTYIVAPVRYRGTACDTALTSA